jgi:flagellar protein FlgJ
MNTFDTPSAPLSTGQYHDLNGLTELKRASREDPNAAISEVAEQFESMFIQMMLKSMRDALPKDGLFSSNDMETYTEMADQQIAVNMAKSGGIGLADVIARQLRPEGGVSEQRQSDVAKQYASNDSELQKPAMMPITDSGANAFEVR